MVDRYRLLTELTPDVVIVHQRRESRLRQPGRRRLIHADSMEQYYGEPVTEFVHPDDIGDDGRRLGQLTSTASSSSTARCASSDPTGHLRGGRHQRSAPRWGGQPAYQVILRDMSERRAAEAADRYRASLVAHVSDAIIGIDAEGRIESWNEAAQAIYGWTEDEVAGLSIGAVVTANRTDSAAVLERGSAPTTARTAPRSTSWCPSTRSSTTTPSPPAGWSCAPSSPTPGRPRPGAGPPRSATRPWSPRSARASSSSTSTATIERPQPGGRHASSGDRLDAGDGHQHLHRVVHRHRGERPPAVRRHVPPRHDPGHRRVRGRRGHRRHRRAAAGASGCR